MDKPYKVIWRFKNENRYVQYHVYIFVGALHGLDNIFKKIENLTLTDTLLQLSEQDMLKIVENYGDKWYKYFFNTYHIAYQIQQIRSNKTMLVDITEKMGKEWVEQHIIKNILADKKILYSYSAQYKSDAEKKITKKERMTGIIDDDMETNYKIGSTKSIQANLSERMQGRNSRTIVSDNQIGGNDEDEDDAISHNEYEIQEQTEPYEEAGGDGEIESDDNTGRKKKEDDAEDSFEKGEDYALTKEEDMDMEEIQKIYEQFDVDPDKDVNKTTALLEKALDENNLLKKRGKKMIEFDREKDNSQYIEKLKDVYHKKFIYSQYLFGDDTIKTIREKICCSIKNNKKFGDVVYLLPSRQYLWSEYIFGEQIEKIMIGQKWIRRNEILDVDVEPDSRLYIYEELKDKLDILKNNIKRYGNKIRRECDENNILYDYTDYINNNDLYMIDLYNEFGSGYSPNKDIQRNLLDVYMRLYFPKLRQEDLKNIIDYLNGNSKNENIKIKTTYETICNDMIIENEITNVIEVARKEGDYHNIFKDNFVTQSVIHVNLQFTSPNNKLDIYRIYNEFVTSETYPYIQYHTIEGGSIYKYEETEINKYIRDKDNKDVLYKWFENAPYGISFKIKISEKWIEGRDKFISIGMNENGRIEYKTQWQEADGATLEDIHNTYRYVKELVLKINKENKRIRIKEPINDDFKFAFINTIQKFELPNKFIINHNDLSEFCRFFYPYIALVIEPRKRQAKIIKADEKSKFGTYLRFKKITKYENLARLEQRIIFFLRNYEFNDTKLAIELAKQFNITEERAVEDIQKARIKYPGLKKSRKVLKKLENVPKYKPPGIGIDIQGKERDKYKVRISGARSKDQLNRIISFMNILIYLYIETYLYKKKERHVLKDRLKKLTNIAKRRSKVEELVNYAKEQKPSKQMAKMDSRRIGFKPEKGQSQWSRNCQNSGNDKKRRPQQYTHETMNKLTQNGYIYNKKTDQYEKKVTVGKGKHANDVVLRTIRVPDHDKSGEKNGQMIHYACDPEENGEHMYVGFLTRSMNPFGQCMPCCFKKDPAKSDNRAKQEFHNQCMGKDGGELGKEQASSKTMGDRLYILQDTNKIQEGRFGFLPKYLDQYFNQLLEKDKKIKHHYLEESTTGYFFKYGSKQHEYQFLNAIGSLIDMSIDDIRTNLISCLEKDKNDQIFCSLNAGDIRTQFKTRENFIKYINESNYLGQLITGQMVQIPGILSKNGINLVIFNKKEIKIKKTLEKELIVEDFYLECIDPEKQYTITDPLYKTIMMIRDGKNYYPIVMVRKNDVHNKDVMIDRIFSYQDDENNVVRHIVDFWNKNCSGSINHGYQAKESITAKDTEYLLKSVGKDYSIKSQVIDIRNRVKYLITTNGHLIPTKPSGSLWNVPIIKSFERYIGTFMNTYKSMQDIYEKSAKKIPVKPVGVYYSDDRNNHINVIAIITRSRDVIPVQPIEMEIKKIEQMDLTYENKPLSDIIDQEIIKGKTNQIVDERISKIKEDVFTEEGYQLFRLELSNYLKNTNNRYYLAKLEKIIENTKLDKMMKVNRIRLLIYRIIDRSLHDKYLELVNLEDIDRDLDQENYEEQIGGKINKLVHRINKLPDLSNYQINNDRRVCPTHVTKGECVMNPHCKWTHGNCYMGLITESIVMYVNRISEELAQNDMRAFEIMQKYDYFVSDIVNRNNFTEMPGQKIIRANSTNIKKILNELFGKDNIPNIGKRIVRVAETDHALLQAEFPIVDLKDRMIQKITKNNISLFRAYANGYYWLKHEYFDVSSKNLGYYSDMQSEIANGFKSAVISWVSYRRNKSKITADIIMGMEVKKTSIDPIKDFVLRIAKEEKTLSKGIAELIILSRLNNIPIRLIDHNDHVMGIFDDGQYLKDPPKEDINRYNPVECINIRYDMMNTSDIPDQIEVVYYK